MNGHSEIKATNGTHRGFATVGCIEGQTFGIYSPTMTGLRNAWNLIHRGEVYFDATKVDRVTLRKYGKNVGAKKS
jgi:hypothetical protein